MDYSKREGKLCSECQHAGRWAHYGPEFRVCHAPQSLQMHGGPRACAEIVRSPGGACGPDAKWFRKRQ